MILSEESKQEIKNCFKCKGTGLKPCKEKQSILKLPCTVCRLRRFDEKEEIGFGFGSAIGFGFGFGSDLELKKKKNEKPSIRMFKLKGNKVVKSNLKPLFDVYNKDKDYSHLNNLLLRPDHENIMLTALCGNWMIFQFKNGHKITTDDCFISALVVQHFSIVEKKPQKYLDLGTGLGSVLQLVAWGLELQTDSSILVGMEAQKIHVELARKSLYINNCPANIIHADLRELTQYSQSEWRDLGVEFDLITGTPPYFPVNNGPLPSSHNRALCSFELRGDVSDYLKTASLLLRKSQDASVFIANGGPVERTVDAGIAVGFQCISRWDLIGIKGKPVLFSVYHFKWNDHVDKDNIKNQVVYCRDENGQFTKEYQDLMCDWIGKPAARFEPHSQPKLKFKKSIQVNQSNIEC